MALNAVLLALPFHFRHGWFFAIFVFCGVIVLANIVHYILFRVLKRKEQEHTGTRWTIQRYLSHPARTIFLLTCVLIVLPLVPGIPQWLHDTVRHWIFMALVVALGWFTVGCVYVVQAVMLRRYDLTAANNVHARRIHTQFQLFRRMIIAFIVVIDIGALLWTFDDPRIWHYGSGLLASAGVASLILAAAAKSTASNFIAGVQIALTEPIRIDDVVVVQGEWGRIEEINSAYVIIKCWDLRRLVVPLSYFIENSFQNWTRESADLLGYSYLYLDYSVPVEPLRQELKRIVSGSKLWDGRVCGLQVTNLTERSMELRCLISSSNSSDAFDLRCIIREEMMNFVRENYPNAFPNARFSATAELPLKVDGMEDVSSAVTTVTQQDRARHNA